MYMATVGVRWCGKVMRGNCCAMQGAVHLYRPGGCLHTSAQHKFWSIGMALVFVVVVVLVERWRAACGVSQDACMGWLAQVGSLAFLSLRDTVHPSRDGKLGFPVGTLVGEWVFSAWHSGGAPDNRGFARQAVAFISSAGLVAC